MLLDVIQNRAEAEACVHLYLKNMTLLKSLFASITLVSNYAALMYYSSTQDIDFFNIYRRPEYNPESVEYMSQLTACLVNFCNTKTSCIVTVDLSCPGIDRINNHSPAENIQDKFLKFCILPMDLCGMSKTLPGCQIFLMLYLFNFV